MEDEMSRSVVPPNIEDLKKMGIKIPETFLEGKAILDIFTEWCGPCKQIAPILHKLRDDGVISLVQEDLDKNRALAEEHNIHAIPTLVFFKDGQRIGDVEGDSSDMPLDEFFSKVADDIDFELLKDGNPVEDLPNYQVRIKRFLVKDGVMVGFPGEKLLQKIINEM